MFRPECLFAIVQAVVVTAVGFSSNYFEAEYVAEIRKQSAIAGCIKAEDFKCPRSEITFWLYTRETQDNPTQLDQFNLSLLKYAPFVKAPLKVLVHGFNNNMNSEINASLRPAYFAHGEYNIISMDWNPLGNGTCYYQAIMNVPTIAHCLAQFFNAVVSSYHFPTVHLMSQSMGSHIAAQASHQIPNLPRLTEFEPSFRLFGDNSRRLIKGIARFIDVYHSNSGFYGRSSPDGHVDVYFNGGVFQPGCDCENLVCSHIRAYQYYAESIGNPDRMVSFRCRCWQDYIHGRCPVLKQSDLVVVGENINFNARGTFYVFTNAEKPFLIDPTRYIDNTFFNSFRNTSDKSCCCNPNLKSCYFNVYCLLLRTFRT